jgi:GrpB-like predicted nucleotidyltransferase (UPF0157 family)
LILIHDLFQITTLYLTLRRHHLVITVVDYDPIWPSTFNELKSTIWPAISDIARAIEHVGSTSVPGLAAKPNIDITIVVKDISGLEQVIGRLATIGYRHGGDQGIPGREAFKRPENTPRHNLYAAVEGDLGLRNHLAIRDHLRRNSDSANTYGALKKQLAEKFTDIDDYVEGKTEFLLGILVQEGIQEEELQTIRDLNRKPTE